MPFSGENVRGALNCNSKNVTNVSLPQKSSKQILNELFNSLNIEPPTSSDCEAEENSETNSESDTSSVRKKSKKKKYKKHKKSKSEDKTKKHKRKYKKKTKKSKSQKIKDYKIHSSSSDVSTEDDEDMQTNNKLVYSNIPENDCVDTMKVVSHNSDKLLINEDKSPVILEKYSENSDNTNVSDDYKKDEANDGKISPERIKYKNDRPSRSPRSTSCRRSSSGKRSNSSQRKVSQQDLKTGSFMGHINRTEDKYQSRSRSKNKYRSRSLSKNKYGSKSRLKSEYRSRSRTKNKYRSKSRTKNRYRSNSRLKNKYRSRSGSKNKYLSRSHSRNKFRSRSRSKNKYPSISHSKNKYRSRSRSKNKHQSRSQSKNKHRSRSRSKNKYRSRSRSKNKFRSRSRSKNKYRSRSQSKRNRPTRSVSKSRNRSKNSSNIRYRSRSISKSRNRSRSRLRSRRLSRSSSTHRGRTHSKNRHQSRIPSNNRFRSRSRKRSKSKDYHKSKHRDRSCSVGRSVKRSVSRTRCSSIESRNYSMGDNDKLKFDKQKLLEIARKNAISMLEQGSLPENVIPIPKEKVTLIKAGGKTVDELTNFCKQLSKKETDNPISASSDDEYVNNKWIKNNSEDEADKVFHHPFQIKDRPSNIVMNIRNSVALPTKTAQEKTTELSKQLRLQFPVSSGQQHRNKQSEWVDVDKTVNTSVGVTNNFSETVVSSSINMEGFDVSSAIASRLEAINQLQQNPNNLAASATIQQIDQQLKLWAESKQELGKFTGSTYAKILTPAELSAGRQAWAMKNQLKSINPITSGFGMKLLQKMGWKPGEGLGKYKQGPVVPFEVDIKVDKRGLMSQNDVSTPSLPRGVQLSSVKVITMPGTTNSGDLNNSNAFRITTPGATPGEQQSKHPVSLLNEYCSRKKIGPPVYTFDEFVENGKRNFLFKVTVHGCEYVPATSCQNKKQGKYDAALVCLQQLGVFPTVAKSA